VRTTPGGLVGAVRVRPFSGPAGRRLCWGLLTALLLVPALGGAIIAFGASLVVQTLSETGFRVCLALALYGVAPTITLGAVLVLARARRGRPFLAGLALGAALLVPASAFDMRGAELSHHGEDCTFETILARYGLTDPGLHELAMLVHEADLADAQFYAPAAVGLDLVTRGLSLVCGDQEALNAGGRIFDGLYEQFRQQLLSGSPALSDLPGRAQRS